MATFRDHLKEKQLLTDDQLKEVAEKASQSRSSTFYSALISSGFLPEDVIVNEACNFFGYEKIEDPFGMVVDFEKSFRFLTIDKIINTKQFIVTSKTDAERSICIIPDPEVDQYKSAAEAAISEGLSFALITAAQYNIFSQYQINPKKSEIQSREVKAVSGNVSLANVKKDASAAQSLLYSLLDGAIDRRASDLHIRAMGEGNPAKVMLRVDGAMQNYTEISGSSLINLRNLLKTMCHVGGEQPDIPVEGQIAVEHNGKVFDTRVNIVYSVGGYDFVLRFITAETRSLTDLGLSDVNLAKVRQLFAHTKGMVLVCGPTGSGKTTLLYAGLMEMLAKGKVIYTLEDPVEIIVPGMVQININKEKQQTYQKKFPSALRHNPDIILIGEIRDGDVATNAIQASNTGHLVLSTIHANDAVGAISRLTNIGIEAYALGEVLVGVIAQRLVRRVCPYCKEEYDLPIDHEWRDTFDLGYAPIKLARGRGCAKCAGTGYLGRICINEIILVNSEVRDAIQTHAPRSVIEEALFKEKFRNYIDDGVEKALAGITTLDELVPYQNELLKSMQSEGVASPKMPVWAEKKEGVS